MFVFPPVSILAFIIILEYELAYDQHVLELCDAYDAEEADREDSRYWHGG